MENTYLDDVKVAKDISAKLYALYEERDGYGDTIHRLADLNDYHKSDFITDEIARLKHMYADVARKIGDVCISFDIASDQCDPLNQPWEQLDDWTINALSHDQYMLDGVYITDWDPIKYEARRKAEAAKKQAIEDAAWNRLTDKEQELYLFGEDDAATYAVDAKMDKLLREEEAKSND